MKMKIDEELISYSGSGIGAMGTIPTIGTEEEEIVFSEEEIDIAVESLALPTNKKKQCQYWKNKKRIGKLAEEDNEVAMMPRDCYSFISLHSPTESIFWFGIMVFLFQIAFLVLALLSIMVTEWNTGKIDDNPWDGVFANLFATEVGPILRATQFVSLLTSIIFVDSSVSDIITAMNTFPNYKIATKNDKVFCMAFSCCLRFCQGTLAVVVSIFLVFNSSNVIEVILNFTALNFISTLDNIFFDFSRTGKYGPYLENVVKRIENRQIPVCMFRSYKHSRFLVRFFCLVIIVIGAGTGIAVSQENESIWETFVFRVQFEDESLTDFNGCYFNDFSRSDYSRRDYYVLDANNTKSDKPRNAEFGFCLEKQQWFLYEVNDETINITNPCEIEEGDVLIFSGGTTTFDIETVFLDDWFTGDGTPAELFFFDEVRDVDKLHCNEFIGDGVCDEFFNTKAFNYDGGDCCATTCTHDRCGTAQLVNAFGTKSIGDGYPNCKDNNMGPITIHLSNFTNSRKQFKEDLYTNAELGYIETYEPGFFAEEPTKTLMTLYCDGVKILKVYVDSSMEGKTEEVQVPDEADCEIRFESMSSEEIRGVNGHPIWFIDYTIYNIEEDKIDNFPPSCSVSSSSRSRYSFERIPKCAVNELFGIYDIDELSGNSAIREAILWVTDATESRNGKCADNWIEAFALSVMYFSAPVHAPSSSQNSSVGWIEKHRPVCEWSKILCVGTFKSTTLDLLELHLSGLNLHGSIPTEIGFLNNVAKYEIARNILTGTIPTEIGSLSSLSSLHLENNLLSGKIPTELFSLTSLEDLDLSYNRFTGPIPTEIGLLTGLRTLALNANYFTGEIPTEIGLLTELTMLSIAGNDRMIGSIPSEIQHLDKLLVMELYLNGLSGSIPSEIGSMTSLIVLDLQKNKISGSIPEEISLLSNLTYLHIGETSVTGLIPTALGELNDLSLFIANVPLQLDQIDASLEENIATQCDLCTTYEEVDDWFCLLTFQEWGRNAQSTSRKKCNVLQTQCIICESEDLQVLAELDLPNN